MTGARVSRSHVRTEQRAYLWTWAVPSTAFVCLGMKETSARQVTYITDSTSLPTNTCTACCDIVWRYRSISNRHQRMRFESVSEFRNLQRSCEQLHLWLWYRIQWNQLRMFVQTPLPCLFNIPRKGKYYFILCVFFQWSMAVLRRLLVNLEALALRQTWQVVLLAHVRVISPAKPVPLVSL